MVVSPFHELQTSSGTVYVPSRELMPIPKGIEDMLDRVSLFIKRVLMRDAQDSGLLNKGIKNQFLSFENGHSLTNWYLSILMVLDCIEESHTFKRFEKNAHPSWKVIQEEEFYILSKNTTQIRAKLLLKDKTKNGQVPSLFGMCIQHLQRRLYDSNYVRVFQEAIYPEAIDMIRNFQNIVNQATSEELAHMAGYVNHDLMRHTGNIVATHVKWKALMGADRLSLKTYNELFYAAAFAAHPKKISSILCSRRSNEITKETAGRALYQIVANKDKENGLLMQRFMGSISDSDFLGALERAVTYLDPDMIGLFRPFADRIRHLKSRMNPYLLIRVQEEYPGVVDFSARSSCAIL